MTVGGVKYGIPTAYSTVHMYANAEVLRKAGYNDIPATYEDLMKCCEALRAIRCYPFGCACYMSNTWCVSEYFESILVKICGAEELDRIFRGEATWGTEDVVQAAEVLQYMISKGYFDPNSAYMGNDEVRARFMNGEYAFYINGSWNSPIFAKNMPEVLIGEFPVINPTKSTMGDTIGGPSESLVVSALTKDPEFVAKYAFEFARRVAKYDYLSEVALSAWIVDYDDSAVNELFRNTSRSDFIGGRKVLYGDNLMDAENVQTYFINLLYLFGMQQDSSMFAYHLQMDIR